MCLVGFRHERLDFWDHQSKPCHVRWLKYLTSPNHVMSDDSNIWPVRTMSCWRIKISDQSKPCHVGWFKYTTSPNHVMFADEEENNIGMLPHIAMGKIVTSGLLNKLNPNPRAKHSLCQANYKGLASPYLWLGQVLLSLCLSTTTTHRRS